MIAIQSLPTCRFREPVIVKPISLAVHNFWCVRFNTVFEHKKGERS